MNDQARNHVDLICLSCGSNLKSDKLHADTVASSSYKLFYVSRGSCVVNVDGTDHAVEQDCSILVFPFQKYKLEQVDNLKFLWIEFSGFTAAAMVSQLAFSRTSPTVGQLNINGFEQFFEYPTCPTYAVHQSYRNGAVILLIMSYYLERFPSRRKRENSYVFSARSYIQDNFSNPGFNVNSVVDYLKIDRSHFYRLFKNETGLSPVDYINRQRISRAEILLSNLRLSIKDVAFSVGFTDQMYFSKVFKSLNRKTPSEFRNLMYM